MVEEEDFSEVNSCFCVMSGHCLITVNEMNIIGAMKMPVGTEFEVIIDGEKYNMKAKINKSKQNINEKELVWDNRGYIKVTITESILNAKFIPIQKPVSFMEAVSSEKNMIKVDIEDIICGLSENMKEQLREYNTIGATLYCLSNYFTNESLVKIFQEGKWYIEG